MFNKFLAKLKETMPRHYFKSYVKTKTLTSIYSEKELTKAFTHCFIHDKCTTSELDCYLIYGYGIEKLKMYFLVQKHYIYLYKVRAKELKDMIFEVEFYNISKLDDFDFEFKV